MDSTIDLKEERDLSGRAEGVRSVDTRLSYCMLKAFHLASKMMFFIFSILY